MKLLGQIPPFLRNLYRSQSLHHVLQLILESPLTLPRLLGVCRGVTGSLLQPLKWWQKNIWALDSLWKAFYTQARHMRRGDLHHLFTCLMDRLRCWDRRTLWWKAHISRSIINLFWLDEAFCSLAIFYPLSLALSPLLSLSLFLPLLRCFEAVLFSKSFSSGVHLCVHHLLFPGSAPPACVQVCNRNVWLV